MRLFDDKDFQAGDIVELIVWETGAVFGEALVTRTLEKPLVSVTAEDYEEMAQYNTVEDILKQFRTYYGDVVQANSPAKVIYFDILALF